METPLNITMKKADEHLATVQETLATKQRKVKLLKVLNHAMGGSKIRTQHNDGVKALKVSLLLLLLL